MYIKHTYTHTHTYMYMYMNMFMFMYTHEHTHMFVRLQTLQEVQSGVVEAIDDTNTCRAWRHCNRFAVLGQLATYHLSLATSPTVCEFKSLGRHYPMLVLVMCTPG